MNNCTRTALLLLVFITLVCGEDPQITAKPNVQPVTKDNVTPTSLKKADEHTNSNSSLVKVELLSPTLGSGFNYNSTGNASTSLKSESETGGVLTRFGLDTGAVKRTFYVVATLTGVVLLYFTFKGVSTLRRRRRKPRRYGLLADNKEMKRFRDVEEEDDSDDGDEDATLFDARKHKTGNHRGN